MQVVATDRLLLVSRSERFPEERQNGFAQKRANGFGNSRSGGSCRPRNVSTCPKGPISGSSDQVSFNELGIPAFQFIWDSRYYETRSVDCNQDTHERLSPEDLKQAAVVEAIILYDAAMRDQIIPHNPKPFSDRPSNLKIVDPDAQSGKQRSR
jgi:hypothetical protein